MKILEKVHLCYSKSSSRILPKFIVYIPQIVHRERLQQFLLEGRIPQDIALAAEYMSEVGAKVLLGATLYTALAHLV